MLELLRPPPHRGPLIAAGVVLLAVGVALIQVRLDADKAHALSAAALAVMALGLGLQVRSDQGAPFAFQSVLLVVGLLALTQALVRGSDVLGIDALEETWVSLIISLIVGAVAALVAFTRESAACLLIAAIAGAVAVMSALDVVFEPSAATVFRWFLLLVGAAYVLVALLLRGSRYRHSVQMVNAAGLCVIAMCLTHIGFTVFFGDPPEVGTGWELVALACGCGLIAFGAVDRQPGPVLLGMVLLALFVVMVGAEEDTLAGWPLAVLVLGGVVVLAGLRPRRPLPPEPEPYRSGEVPLANRTAGDATVTSVRVD